MKKIIAAIDGLKYSESTVEYAVELARQTNSHLVGVFLDDQTYHSYKIYDLIHNKERVTEEVIEKCEYEDRENRTIAADQFRFACETAGLNYSAHHDRNIAIHELLHESIYADLLVIGAKETFTQYEENRPTHFIRDLLTNVECPVLVVPEKFQQIEKVVLLYDGEPSSVYAIKMFSYMFPSLKEKETEVISVKTVNQDMHVPDNRLMKEFMKRHFPQAAYTVLKGLPDIEIVNHLKCKTQHELIVLGAYQRNMVSRWFRPSMADALMQELQTPLFIAHNK